MSTIHCGNKFLFHTVFKRLFITPLPSTLVGGRKLSTAVIERHPPPRSRHNYNQLIKSHAKMFKKTDTAQKEAIELLKKMEQKGIAPNSQTYLQLIIGMSHQRHRTNIQNERLELWINELLAIEKPKKRLAGTVDKLKRILHCLSFRGHPKLKEIFLRISSEYSLTNIKYWHQAMEGCIMARKIEDAEYLYDLARERNIATKSTYQTLIQSHLYLKDQKSASRIFSDMLNDQVTADYEICELFMNYYMDLPFTKDNSETLDKLWQAILMTVEENSIPSDVVQKYLSYFGQYGELSKAEQVYLDLRTRRQKLDRRCFGEMNKVIIRFSNRRQLPSALSLYYDLLAQGYEPSQNVISKIQEACIAMKDKESIQQLLDITIEYKSQTPK